MSKKIKFPFKYKLKIPIDNGEKELLKELVIHQKPTWGAMKNMPITAPSMGDLQVVASNLTNEPLAIIEKLDAKDGMALAEVVASFL